MTNPQMPNPITEVMNSTFTGAPDSSLLSMVLVSTALAAVYLVVAALCRRRFPKSMDLAFALALATPITSFIVLGHMGWGLIIGGIALVIGLVLWGTGRGKLSENQPGNTGRVR
ncbi:hypothetical protein FQP90_13385 [Paenarthrobacter nitroguajacolicus]|uniref:Uncharacterized protein n=1 Tax=Paenarthrobacter nitroguajacolicus TaxID=211146 RepID=A0A558GYY4_PAENT|nr:hypothetical protein [Paenarthrobacter nitroguajacolicus]TVU62042.1 hypothetical protein FQP90_13385 [Paenarthrobacter nitroguajacolicus]